MTQEFFSHESCGQCTPCREGLKQMLAILTDICEGRGTLEDLDLLEQLGRLTPADRPAEGGSAE